MKFDYMVKYNGVYYNVGEDVPMGASSKTVESVVDTPKVEEVIAEEVETEKPKKAKRTTKAKED